MGTALAEISSLLPNATCTAKPGDAGIVLCMDSTNTLGGEPAAVTVKLLDGQTVEVSIENLTYEQAFSACAPLTAKFGPASETGKIRVKLQRGRYVETQDKPRCVWQDGETFLYIEPADWTNQKKRFTYSAIRLVDEARHNREWIVRYNATKTPKDL